MNFRCAKCGKIVPVSTRAPKCECGGLWKLDFQPPKFTLEDIDKDEWSLFRYRKFMALEDDSWKAAASIICRRSLPFRAKSAIL